MAHSNCYECYTPLVTGKDSRTCKPHSLHRFPVEAASWLWSLKRESVMVSFWDQSFGSLFEGHPLPLDNFLMGASTSTGFPSIQSILKVTGRVDIEKFNKGFEEGIKCSQEEDHIGKQSQQKSLDEEKVLNSVPKETVWFKKQLVQRSQRDKSLECPDCGISGIKCTHLIVSC